jgi:asparagine synthase (glutamine-hydrolysing)
MATAEFGLQQQGATERLGARSWVARLGEGADGIGLEVLVPDDAIAPGRAEDSSLVVVLDGVLHDRDVLRRALGAPSDSGSDAELVLGAYRRFGPRMLDRLRGVFALLVWDAERRALLCARDQMGLHPLFYVDGGHALYVSSSIHALLAHEAIPAGVNRAALADHLLHRWPDPGETYFEAIRRVPPAHVLHAGAAGLRVERYWDPVPAGQEPEWVRADELDRFDALLAQAVDRALSLGPSAIFLSGGLDSVSAGAVAADQSRARGLEPPLALSLGFPDPECNEERVQRGVSRALGIDQVMLPFEEALPRDGLLASAIELSPRLPSPVVSYWAPAYLRLAVEGKSLGRDVILTGHGGDEWLTVSPLYAADLWRSLDLRGLARLGACEQRAFPVSPARLWFNLAWTFGTKVLLTSAAARSLSRVAPSALGAYRRWDARRSILDWVAPDGALRKEVEHRAEHRPPKRDKSHYLHELRMSLDHPLTSLELEEVFENGRSAGVHVIPPYLDADLVDFLYRIPPRLLDRGGWSKGLVRERLARRFPDLGFQQQRKIAATSYARSVMKDQVVTEWERLGGIPALAELGVASQDGFGPIVASAAGGDYLSQFRVWDALNLEAWLRSHL